MPFTNLGLSRCLSRPGRWARPRASPAACCRTWSCRPSTWRTSSRTRSRPSWSAFAAALLGSCWPRRFTGCGVLDPADARRHVRAALPVPRPQVVVRRAVRAAVRAAGAAHFRLGSRRSTERDRLAGRRLGPGRGGRLPAGRLDRPDLRRRAWSTCWPAGPTRRACRLRRIQTGNVRQYVMWHRRRRWWGCSC